MSNQLKRMMVILDTEQHPDLGTTLHIEVKRVGENDVHVKRIIPDNDFMSHWDYVWDVCKRLLDDELKVNI